MRAISVFLAAAVCGVAATASTLAHPQSSGSPRAWGADAGRIAFFRSADGGDGGAVWIMSSDGTHQRRLTREDDAEPGLTWSPDGRMLAFESFRGAAEPSIWVMSAEGKHLRRIPGTKSRIGPAWSPDGRRIAMSGVLVMNPDGTGKRTVARGWGPSWSPDGRMLLFSRETNGSDDRSIELFVVGVDGRGERRVTRNSVLDRFPAWSPDGRLIAFERLDSGTGSVCVMDVDGRDVRRLASGGSPSWSPDGRKIVFDRNFTIWVMNRDGSGQHRISPEPGRPRLSLGTHAAPEWEPAP